MKKTAESKKVIVYKYRVFPQNQAPDFPEEIKSCIFEQARRMNRLWNKMLEMRQKTLDTLTARFAEAKTEAGFTEDKKLSSREMRKISGDFADYYERAWSGFNSELTELLRDPLIKAELGWEASEDVYNRFLTAHQRAFKNGGNLRFKSSFIEAFHLPHRFTRGGMEIDKVFSKRSKKIWIERLDPAVFENESYRQRRRRVADGYFGCGLRDETQIPLRIVVHRALPSAAVIKLVNFIGKRKKLGWEYFINLVCELEKAPENKSFPTLRPGAALDLGWRKFDDYVRFGMLVDTKGNLFEFRLPINGQKNASQRRLEKMLAQHGAADKIRNYPNTWQDIEDWQRTNDLALEKAKEKVRKLKLPSSEAIKKILPNLAKARNHGLLRLLRELETAAADGDALADVQTAINTLRVWREETIFREEKIETIRTRLLNRRRHIYLNLSLWLKNNYSQLIINGDLSLSQIAAGAPLASPLDPTGWAIRNAAKFRFMVGLSELINRLGQLSTGNWLKKEKADNSTRQCHICGEMSEPSLKLKIVCPAGHKFDQDINASMNLIKKLSENIAFDRTTGDVQIPEALKNIVIPLAAGERNTK